MSVSDPSALEEQVQTPRLQETPIQQDKEPTLKDAFIAVTQAWSADHYPYVQGRCPGEKIEEESRETD